MMRRIGKMISKRKQKRRNRLRASCWLIRSKKRQLLRLRRRDKLILQTLRRKERREKLKGLQRRTENLKKN
jgi:hypothetical protein